MWPSVISISPVIIFMVVDLPDPFGPRYPVTSPGCAEKLTLSTAGIPEKRFETLRSSSIALVPFDLLLLTAALQGNHSSPEGNRHRWRRRHRDLHWVESPSIRLYRTLRLDDLAKPTVHVEGPFSVA